MTSTSTNEKLLSPKLIHVGKSKPYKQKERYLFLRELSPHHFAWYEDVDGHETATEIFASTVEEALRLAHRLWKRDIFRPMICGFRYTLPERDEHGMNALFHQMAASYSSPSGIYFDEALGHNCCVHNASQEALDLWRKLNDGRKT